ncbi:adenosylhomocysteinase [Agromyces subbeticus]|uniref:adenosylhomocysteinase n=1 Tax=Agromyces subbeticus TaxID=293890 RepID=UPI0003B4619F|nr:adenosylhomocysteinase [Agromyces subbeticus]
MTTESKNLTRLDWVIRNTRLLGAIGDEYDETQPFAGMRIATGIHLEPKTASLLLTLRRGGATVTATGNLNSTQTETTDFLSANGVTIVGHQTQDADVHRGFIRELVAGRPDLILDNGGELFSAYLETPYTGLLGGTEETTSGRMRLMPLRDQLQLPIYVINDSPIKQFAENLHAVGQSVFESFMRITNLSTNGKRVTVFGYGACGQGVAANFRAANSLVTVVESDPVRRLQALLDGFIITDRAEAISSADAIVTVTGAPSIVTAADLPLFRDGVILSNAGHFPREITPEIETSPEVVGVETFDSGMSGLHLTDGRIVNLINHGHMMNLSGQRPLGNSIESMDIGFALQARSLEYIATGSGRPTDSLVPVPRSIDASVANAFVALRTGAAPVEGKAEALTIAG